jgi:hypothetical protein
MPELNSVTRRNLWYITIALLADGIVALSAGIKLPADSAWAAPVFIEGLLSLVVSVAALAPFLIVTSEPVKNYFAEREKNKVRTRE